MVIPSILQPITKFFEGKTLLRKIGLPAIFWACSLQTYQLLHQHNFVILDLDQLFLYFAMIWGFKKKIMHFQQNVKLRKHALLNIDYVVNMLTKKKLKFGAVIQPLVLRFNLIPNLIPMRRSRRWGWKGRELGERETFDG